MLSELQAREPGIVEAIRNDREIKQETEKSLTAFIENLLQTFG